MSKYPINVIPFFGGKSGHLDFILPLLPPTEIFVEGFGGSGAVIINRQPSPTDVYNDLFDPIVNLMRVIKSDPEALAGLLKLTPYARKEYELCMHQRGEPLEKARQFLAYAMQRHSVSHHVAYKRSWGREKLGKGMRPTNLRNKVGAVLAAGRRLQDVAIEHMDVLDLIETYDSPETLFYLDPPYVKDTRAFGHYGAHEYPDESHRDLAFSLNNIKGMAAVSGYASPLYDEELFPGWLRYDNTAKKIGRRGGHVRVECLWTNYEVR